MVRNKPFNDKVESKPVNMLKNGNAKQRDSPWLKKSGSGYESFNLLSRNQAIIDIFIELRKLCYEGKEFNKNVRYINGLL